MFKYIINIIFWMLCVYSSMVNGEIFKWTDAQGKVHYGDRVNSKSTEKIEAMDVDIKRQGNLKVNREREDKRKKLLNAFDEDRSRKNKQKLKDKKNNKKKAKACVRYKDKMRRYNRASSLYRLDKVGNRVVMSNEEREKSTEKLRKRIKKYCK